MTERNRTYYLQEKILECIAEQEKLCIERDEPLNWERLHMASSARLAWTMALERGADPELASSAAAIHDIGRIVTGKAVGHAEAGEEPARALLKELGLYSEEEIDVIATAVKNHSKKHEMGSLIEEIVKDTDVVDCVLYGYGSYYRPEIKERYEKWLSSR